MDARAVHRGQDAGLARMHPGAQADGQPVRVQRILRGAIHRAVDAQHAVAPDVPQHLALPQEAALQFARHALLPLLHRHDIRLQHLSLADGQHRAGVPVGDRMAQGGVAPRVRVIEGQRAHACGGIPHPGAQADRPGGFVLVGGEQRRAVFARPPVGDLHLGRADLVQQPGQRLGGGDGGAVHPGDDVPCGQPGGFCRADVLRHVAQPDDQHPLRAHGHTQGLSAGNQPLLRADLHFHLFQRNPEERQQHVRRAHPLADHLHRAHGREGFIAGGGDGQRIALQRQPAQAQRADLPLGEGEGVRQVAQGCLHGRKPAQRQQDGQDKANGFAQLRGLSHSVTSCSQEVWLIHRPAMLGKSAMPRPPRNAGRPLTRFGDAACVNALLAV